MDAWHHKHRCSIILMYILGFWLATAIELDSINMKSFGVEILWECSKRTPVVNGGREGGWDSFEFQLSNSRREWMNAPIRFFIWWGSFSLPRQPHHHHPIAFIMFILYDLQLRISVSNSTLCCLNRRTLLMNSSTKKRSRKFCEGIAKILLTPLARWMSKKRRKKILMIGGNCMRVRFDSRLFLMRRRKKSRCGGNTNKRMRD